MKISDKLVAAVRQQIFNDFGLTLPNVLKIETAYVHVANVPLAPVLLGIMAPMIDNGSVEIMVGYQEETEIDPEKAFLLYNYSYTHPDGGHNGYTHRLILTGDQ